MRATVRARLACLQRALPGGTIGPSVGPAPPLLLFGSAHQLDYFSDDEQSAAPAPAPVALVAPSASCLLSARRQARRKLAALLVAPPPPPPADLLGGILESQARLHSPGARLALEGDGRVRVTVPSRQTVRAAAGGHAGSPGGQQTRRAGGWGGGYRGQYSRERHGPLDRDRHYPPAAPLSTPPTLPDGPDLPPSSNEPPRAQCETPPRRRPAETDTDKYDPTEPTHDESSGDEHSKPPREPPESLLRAATDSVLRSLRPAGPGCQDSDSDSGGDCPNFSIYSATSVHIANNSSSLLDGPAPLQPPPPPPLALRLPSREFNSAAVLKSVDYNEKVSKRCPITPNKRNPIKIKLSAPTLIKRHVSLYDDEDLVDEEVGAGHLQLVDEHTEVDEVDECDEHDEHNECDEPDGRDGHDEEVERDERDTREAAENGTETGSPEGADRDSDHYDTPLLDLVDKTSDKQSDASLPPDPEDPDDRPAHSDNDHDRQPDEKITNSLRKRDNLDKMTESISETEDERSYTPCLDENKSKDTSLETEKENLGIEGLDTEMISDDDENELFSDGEQAAASAGRERTAAPADTGRKQLSDIRNQTDKKKKKKDSKKEARKKSKKVDVAFKKLNKSGKERNYRDKDRQEGEGGVDGDKADKRSKGRSTSEQGRRKRRQDLERYNVRTLVGDKRRKDAFGRDVSPMHSSPSPPPPAEPVPAPAPPRRARRDRKRRRSPTPPPRTPRTPPRTPRLPKKKKAERSRRRDRSDDRRTRRARRESRSPSRRSPAKRKKKKRRAPSPPREAVWRSPEPEPPRALSPGWTPPPERDRARRKRPKEPGPSKEVFTSGDNILVSVSFNDEAAAVRRERRARRRRRPVEDAAKPVAIIDLERSPFREITPSPKNVIVLSDSDHAERPEARPAAPPEPSPTPELPPPAGPKTPPEPEPPPEPETSPAARPATPLTDCPAASSPGPPAAAPAQPPPPVVTGSPRAPSPDTYDPLSPTRSPDAAPVSATPTIATTPATLTLEAATLLGARPVSPLQKVLALLASTRDTPPPAAPLPPAVPPLLSATAPLLSTPLSTHGESPYSPGENDFGDLFSPPPADPFDALCVTRPPAQRARGRTRTRNKGEFYIIDLSYRTAVSRPLLYVNAILKIHTHPDCPRRCLFFKLFSIK